MGEGRYKEKNIIVEKGERKREMKGIEKEGKLIWKYFEEMVKKEMKK